MGLFSKKEKKKTTIFDLLSIDLMNINKSEFEFLSVETNTQGEDFKRYRKKINELDLFYLMDVLDFEDNFISCFFYADSKTLDFNKLGNLINLLHKEYGVDSLQNGIFNSDDVNHIKEGVYWTGRMWTDIKPEIMFDLIEEGSILQMSILGVKSLVD